MFLKTCYLEKKINAQEQTLEEIRQLLVNRTEVLTKPKNFPQLPLQTVADAETAEEKIRSDDSIKDFVVIC